MHSSWQQIVVVLLVSASAVAGQQPKQGHPAMVAQPGATSAKTCLGCHTSLRGKYTHSAITKSGCLSCHEIRSQEGETSVALIASGNALCLQCHSDKQAKAGTRQHPPAVEGECAACHDPHASPHPNQLLQAASGSKAENLCLTCHEIGVEVPAGGSRHPALDLGCDACHVTHKSGDPEQPEFAFHLIAAPPALCLNCHDSGDKQLGQAHAGQPFATANCVGCHSPHASEGRKLTYKFTHPPFDDRQCDACHEPTQNGKLALIEGGTRALCFTCHEELRQQITSAKQPHGLFEVEDVCTNCHSPHATQYPFHLRQPMIALCTGCHVERQEERTTKKFVHRPVFEAGCTVCHEPHASDYRARLRAPVNDVCLACHGAEGPPEQGGVATLFGKVQVNAGLFKAIRRVDLSKDGTRGHPLMQHLVSGPNPLKPGETLSCVSCHNPHASDFTKRMFQLRAGAKSLCLGCHG